MTTVPSGGTYLQWWPLYPVVVPTYCGNHCTQWWYLPIVVTTVPSGGTYLQWWPLYPVEVPTYSDDHCTQWWYLPIVVTTVPSGGTYLLWWPLWWRRRQNCGSPSYWRCSRYPPLLRCHRHAELSVTTFVTSLVGCTNSCLCEKSK